MEVGEHLVRQRRVEELVHIRQDNQERPLVNMRKGHKLMEESISSEMETGLVNLNINLKGEVPAIQREQGAQKSHAKRQLEVSSLVQENTGCLDIDRGSAYKKVMPVEDEEERVSCEEIKQVIKKKNLSLKRPHNDHQQFCSTTKPMNVPQPYALLDQINKTVNLIDKARKKEVSTGEIIYSEQIFSGFNALEELKVADGGSYGEVWKCLDSKTKQRLVLKRISKIDDVTANEILVPIQFPDQVNIAQIYGCQLKNSKFSIVMEDAGESICRLIKNPEFQELLKYKLDPMVLGMLEGVMALARCQVTHADIKPENVCFNMETGVIKLVDFGSSSTLKDPVTYKGTTVEYSDPKTCGAIVELLKGGQQQNKRTMDLPRLGEPYDVWATMLVIVFLILKKHLMVALFYNPSGVYDPKLSRDELYHFRYFLVAKNISQLTDAHLRAILDPKKIGDSMSLAVQELLRRGLTVNSDSRPSAQQLRDWFQNELTVFSEGRPTAKALKMMDFDDEPQLMVEEDEMDIDLKLQGSCKPQAELAMSKSIERGPASGIQKGAVTEQSSGPILMPSKLRKVGAGFPGSTLRSPPAQSRKVMDPDYEELVASFLPEPSDLLSAVRWKNATGRSAVNPQLFGQPAQIARTATPEVTQQLNRLAVHRQAFPQGLLGQHVGQGPAPSQARIEREKACGGNIPFFIE